MNDDQLKQIEEFKQIVLTFLASVTPDEKGQLNKGFIFIPIEEFKTGRPVILGMCDAELLGLKFSRMQKDMARHVLYMKVMQSTDDKSEQEMLLAEIK